MPSERNRRKDDTWTTDELDRALKGSRNEAEKRRQRRDADDRGHRDHDSDRKERRRHKDDINGDGDERRRKKEDGRAHGGASEDKRRRRKDESPDDGVRLSEEDRERLRQERREKREKKEPGKSEKKERKRDAPVIEEDDNYRPRHRDRDVDRRRHRDEDGDRRHGREEVDTGRRRDEDRRRRHRDEDDSRRRHRDDNRHRDRDEDNRRRHDEDRRQNRQKDDTERQRQERREKKERKEKDKRNERDEEKRDRGKESRQSDDRHRERNEEARRGTTELRTENHRKKDLEQEENKDGDDYNYDDDDFEDYEEDFEEGDDDDDDNENRKNDAEMDDILKAMDEENTRLAAGSRRSNMSDSTDTEDKKQEVPAKTNKARTFIDFVSAKQVALNSKTASRTKKRGADLLQMIELDIARYDMFDLPPVREYEMYIRSFGRSNTKQAYVQTNEDNIDRDIQTDEIESKQKWTQHPSEDFLGVGGDGIDAETIRNSQTVGSGSSDSASLAKFVEKTGQTIGILLEETREGSGKHRQTNKSSVGFTDGFIELGSHKFIKDRCVTHACFCPNQPNMLLTVFSSCQQVTDNPLDNYGLICAWNTNDLSYPNRILCCEAVPVCCCFSPMKASLAFSGMSDGSVVVWDLRELASMHQTVKVHEQEHVVRFPTYSTAGIQEVDNHHSPITNVSPVYSTAVRSKTETAEDGRSSLSFQLATLEQNAVVNFWVVTEISSADSGGSESDLGLAPGGKIKLLKSSSVTLYSPNRSLQMKSSMRVFEMQLQPSDLNHLYAGTDMGHVVHSVRFGSHTFPRRYCPKTEYPTKVTSLDFSPFSCSYLLTGCDDGSLHLYHTKYEHAFLSWPSVSDGCSISCVRWSPSRPAVFYILDDNSTVHVFDLLENDSQPIFRDQIPQARVVTMCLTSDSCTGLSSKQPQLVLALDNGRTEVHSLIPQLTSKQTLEEDFLERYIEKF